MDWEGTCTGACQNLILFCHTSCSTIDWNTQTWTQLYDFRVWCSSVASPICQAGQSERIFLFLSFLPDFSSFSWFLSLFFPIFPLFFPIFGKFFAVRGTLCCLDMPVATPLIWCCQDFICSCSVLIQTSWGRKQQGIPFSLILSYIDTLNNKRTIQNHLTWRSYYCMPEWNLYKTHIKRVFRYLLL